LSKRNWLIGGAGMLVVLVVFAAVFLAWLNQFTDEIFPGLHDMYRSDSMQPLDLLLGEHKDHIRIPRAYLFALDPPEHGAHYDVQFSAFLPDMETEQEYDVYHPLAMTDLADNKKYADAELLIDVNGSYWDTPAEGEKMFQDDISEIRRTNTKVVGNVVPGYDVYFWAPSNNHIDQSHYKSGYLTYYIPKNERDYYVICFYEDSPTGSCSIILYRSTIYTTVDFNPKNLNKADFIKKTVNDFLTKITINP
jgi:hypothetical protein